MMHQLICGVSQSGKTTLARHMARELRERGQNVIVYDPLGSPTAGGDWGQGAIVFDDKDNFLDYLEHEKTQHAHVFVDEADLIYSHNQPENHWHLRRGRHWGLFFYPITQRPTLIAPNVRSMCTRAFCFRLVQDDIKQVAADYGFNDAHKIVLTKGDFLCFTAGVAEFERGNIFSILSK